MSSVNRSQCDVQTTNENEDWHVEIMLSPFEAHERCISRAHRPLEIGTYVRIRRKTSVPLWRSPLLHLFCFHPLPQPTLPAAHWSLNSNSFCIGRRESPSPLEWLQCKYYSTLNSCLMFLYLLSANRFLWLLRKFTIHTLCGCAFYCSHPLVFVPKCIGILLLQ